MLKENKGKFIISSIIILLPILIGILLWDKLPETMVTHWDANGVPNGYSPKAFVVFGMPLLLFAMQFLCIWFMQFSNKTVTQNKQAKAIIFWIIPVVSALAMGATYALALGKEINLAVIGPLFAGLLFIVVGNYLPKVKQNWVLGIRLPWTLQDEENWNKTHRLAGKVWVVCGFIMLLTALTSGKVAFTIMMILLFFMIGVPSVYSYKLYQKSVKEE